MARWFAALIMALLVPGIGWTQDEIIKDFTPAHVEQFLKDVLKIKADKREDPDRGRIVYGTPQGHFDIEFYAKPQKMLVFIYPYGALKTTPERVKEWNAAKKLTVTSRELDGKISLAAVINLEKGTSFERLDKLYAAIQQERQEFEAFAQGKGTKVGPKKSGPAERVRQGFPADNYDPDVNGLGKCDSGWDIEWDISPVGTKGTVFRIVSATFHWKDVNGTPRSLGVLRNLQLVEAFTQYDDMGTCWLDIAKVGLRNVPAYENFLGPPCVGKGKILESTTPAHNKKVYQELHYDGLRWVSLYGGDRARRGEKLVLWSAIASGNYVYLMEYNFTDDGRIVTRLGFTAHNYFDREKLPKRRTPYGFRKGDKDVHPHIGCWRFDFDLRDPKNMQSGPEANDIKLVQRMFDETKKEFYLDARPFPGDDKAKQQGEAREGKAKWIAKHFTMLRAQSTAVKNTRGQPIAYDLISLRTGTAADLQPFHQAAGTKMDFVNYDFWVTRTPVAFKHYYELPDFMKNAPIANQATTVWHSVAGLHVPRDEDFGPDGLDAERGAALTEWISFTLRPRNLFDGTPFYGSKK